MKKIQTCCLACVFAAAAAFASPNMAAVSEASSTNSVALSLQSYTSLLANDSKALDLTGLIAAWSDGVGLSTYPFVGLLIRVF